WRTLTRDKVYQTCDRRLVELIAKERAEWDKTSWQQKIPTVLKSIGLSENSKVGLEQLLGYWSQVVKSQNSANPDSKANDEPIGYYSSRSLDWHKGTFCELLEHRFSNRGTKEKSAQREVPSAKESSENGCHSTLIATNKA
ncbi:MAG: hypothetical protein ICV63_18645, partial [Coleofasciculus sp. Co-bin14]|nr:hypothetical protein [Coleofasciculus sp. Co-bin14]